MNKVPLSWQLSSLGEIAADISYGFTTPSTLEGHGVKLLRITDIQNDRVDWPDVPRCSETPSRQYLLRVGDIVIARTGATTGKSYLIEEVPEDAVYASYLIRVRVKEVEPRYLWSFLKSKDYWDQIQLVSKGTAQPGANATILGQVQLPIAPLAEQQRIVTKIDALSAKSDRARGHLDHLPRLVEKYKQAVLAAAFSGGLTREWRTRNRRPATTADIVEACRVEAWGRAKRVEQVRGRYPTPLPIEWKPHIDLPTSWTWASVDQASYATQYGTSAKTSDDVAGVAVLRMGNIQSGDLDLSSLKFLPRDHDEFPELILTVGDVLFNRTNSAELVGKTAVYMGEPALASFASYLIRVRCCAILPSLLSGYINSLHGREWVASVVNQQVGQANVNGTKLKQLGVPIMPVDEQLEIERRLAVAFSWIDRLAAEAASARKLVDHLDQAVLAKAFRGELVPQDPNDEPANVLLERIKTERAKPQSRTGGRGRRPRGTA